jgi:hypothetical protein
VLLCAYALLACGCAGARDSAAPEGVVVWEASKEQWVRLEPRDAAGSPPNDHPAQVEAGEITGTLASLRVVVDESAEPIFTSSEATQLGEAIARALAQAQPDQDVAFRSVGSRPLTSGKVLKGVSVNTGRVFRQDGKLNLILGDVRARAKTKSVYGQWEEDFSKPRPAIRSASAEHEWKVVAPAGVEQRNGRDDWLAFDDSQLAGLAAAAVGAAPATTASPATAPAVASPSSAPAAAAPMAAPAPAAPPAPAAAAPAADPEADMERRLRTLKDLRDKGLITEEAYRAKIEEILSVL